MRKHSIYSKVLSGNTARLIVLMICTVLTFMAIALILEQLDRFT